MQPLNILFSLFWYPNYEPDNSWKIFLFASFFFPSHFFILNVLCSELLHFVLLCFPFSLDQIFILHSSHSVIALDSEATLFFPFHFFFPNQHGFLSFTLREVRVKIHTYCFFCFFFLKLDPWHSSGVYMLVLPSSFL